MAATTLTVLALMGPLTTSAVAYVLVCTPSTGASGSAVTALYIYNSTATTANVTAKVLSRTNVHLSTLISPATFTIAGGNTKVAYYTNPATAGGGSFTYDEQNAAFFPATIRITSDQPIVAGILAAHGTNTLLNCLPATF